VWRFKLENRDYTIELFNSVLSGKKKILNNGQSIYYDSKYAYFFILMGVLRYKGAF